jgi:hypothetical protein
VIWVARIGSIRIPTNYAVLHEAMPRYHFSNLRFLPFYRDLGSADWLNRHLNQLRHAA